MKTPAGKRGVVWGSAVVATLAGALAACGSSPATPGPDGGGGSAGAAAAPLSAAAFCAQEREQTAAFSARCLGGSAADWKAYRDAYMPCSRFDELIAAGTVRYHADRAAACLAANSADRDCAAPENFCFTSTLEGLVAARAPCRNDYECPPNAACWAPMEFGLNACVQSVCVTVGDKVGDPCTDLPFCYPGVVTCLQGTCVAYGKNGEACGQVDQPFCGPGLRCDATGTCVPLSSGSLCNADFECFGTDFCDNSQCRPRIAVGASCNGAPHGCVGWASCNTQTFVCEAAGHVGQACGSTMGDDSLCIGGACQNNADGSRSCIALAQLGAVCNVGVQCQSGGCASGTCATCDN
jgi:hypothetical protein